jgi:hypothetical protein
MALGEEKFIKQKKEMDRAQWAHRPATVPSAAATFTTGHRCLHQTPQPATTAQSAPLTTTPPPATASTTTTC